jgi:anti-sigma B factor antagonist
VTAPAWSAPFGVALRFDDGQAVLDVRQEVDLLTAPELEAILRAVLERGHRNVVLDLAALEFIDAAGLGVIAQAATRLRSAGGELTVRSPDAFRRRLLELTRLDQLVHIDAPDADAAETVAAVALAAALPAQGIHMARTGVSPDGAFRSLVDESRRQGRGLGDIAAGVVASADAPASGRSGEGRR